MIDWAMYYANMGWSVFPLHTLVLTVGQAPQCSCRNAGCTNIAKHPRTKNGFLDATTDLAQIASWWETWPESNIGIATGPSGLVVIDIDPRHGGNDSIEILQEAVGGKVLETVTVLTGGGGTHLFFKAMSDVPSGANVLGPGVDIRAQGGYVCAVPSMHASGKVYEYEIGYGPDVPMLEFGPELISRLSAPKKTVSLGEHETGEIIDGQRNVMITKWAGYFRRKGMSAKEIVIAIAAINQNRCKPPLEDAELYTIANSVARYAPEAPIEEMTAKVSAPLSTGPEPVGNALLRVWAQPVIDIRRLPTGIPMLDALTRGLHPGEMTALGAWSGVGKSGLATQIALESGKEYRVLFFPLELGVARTEKRMLAQIMRTDEEDIDMLFRYNRGNEVYPYMEVLQSRKIEMLAPPIGEIFGYREIEEMIKQRKPDLVIIDHLQHIDDWTPASSKRSDLTAAKIVREIHHLAVSESFHLILVAQLKAEKIKKKQRPELYDFADTAALPRVADNVWLLNRPFRGEAGRDNIMEIIVAKNRRGPECWIHTHFIGKSMMMLPMTREEVTEAICCKKNAHE